LVGDGTPLPVGRLLVAGVRVVGFELGFRPDPGLIGAGPPL
jgi:hypothetical protein